MERGRKTKAQARACVKRDMLTVRKRKEDVMSRAEKYYKMEEENRSYVYFLQNASLKVEQMVDYRMI